MTSPLYHPARSGRPARWLERSAGLHGSGTQYGAWHGGQESTILTMIPTLLHHEWSSSGCHAFQGRSRFDQITGGFPTAPRPLPN